MEGNAENGVIARKVRKALRVVQRGGLIFYHGQRYVVSSELAGKRVRLIEDPNNLNIIEIEFEAGKSLGEAVLLVVKGTEGPETLE